MQVSDQSAMAPIIMQVMQRQSATAPIIMQVMQRSESNGANHHASYEAIREQRRYGAHSANHHSARIRASNGASHDVQRSQSNSH